MRYLIDEHGGVHVVTNESPPNFRGVLFVGHGPTEGGGVETIHEQLYSVARIQGMTPAGNVPAAWRLALGYEEPVPIECEHQVIDITWWPFTSASSPAEKTWTSDQTLAYGLGMLASVIAIMWLTMLR